MSEIRPLELRPPATAPPGAPSARPASPAAGARRPWWRRPKVLAILAGSALAIGALTYPLWRTLAPAAAKPTAKAARGSLRITLIEDGSLKAKDSIKISAEMESQVTILKIIDAGTLVKKDDILVEFDKKDLEQRVSKLQIDVQGADQEAVQSKEDVSIQKITNEGEIKRVEESAMMAEKELKKFIEIEGSKAVKEAQIRIDQAQVTLDDATRDLAEVEVMVKEELVAPKELEKAKITLKNAGTSLETSRMDLQLITEYTNPLTELRLRNALEAARRELEKTRSVTLSTLSQKETQLLRATATQKEYHMQLEEAQEELGKMTIKAPSDGLVVYGDGDNGWGNDDALKVGGKVWGGQTLMTLPNLSKMLVETAVNEADVDKMKKDQTATIVPEAFPNMTLHARVTEVGQVAQSANRRWWSMGGGSKFDVKLEVDETETRLKPGMKVKVEIFIEELSNVLLVPVDAVFQKDGKSFCHVRRGVSVESRPVKVGKSNDLSVEILEGLQEGETVCLYEPAEAEGKKP